MDINMEESFVNILLETSKNIDNAEKIIRKLGLKLYKKKINIIPVDDEWEDKKRNYKISLTDLYKLENIVAKIPEDINVSLTYSENGEFKIITNDKLEEELEDEKTEEEETKEEEEAKEIQENDKENFIEKDTCNETDKDNNRNEEEEKVEEEEESESKNYSEAEKEQIASYFMNIIHYDKTKKNTVEDFLIQANYNIQKAFALYMKFSFPELCINK